MDANTNAIVALLTGWASSLSASKRKALYKAAKYVSGALTLALLVLPYATPVASFLHLSVPANTWTVVTTVITAALTLVSHVADSNLDTTPVFEADDEPATEVAVDSAPAPVSATPVATPTAALPGTITPPAGS